MDPFGWSTVTAGLGMKPSLGIRIHFIAKMSPLTRKSAWADHSTIGYKPSFAPRVDIHARQDFEFAVQPDLLRHLVKLMMTGGLPEQIVAEVASGRELGIPLAVPAHNQAASA